MSSHLLVLMSLLVLIACTPRVIADDLLPLAAIDEQSIKRSFIAFIGATSTPGLESAQLSVDTPTRTSDISRSSLGFNAEFTLPDRIENGYWGAGLLAGKHQDQILLADESGDVLQLNVVREMRGIRLSYGWSLPITPALKIRPYMTGSWMQTQTEFGLTGALPDGVSGSALDAMFDDVDTVSLAGNLDMEYVYWSEQAQWLIGAQLNAMYTDVLDSNFELGDTDDWTHAHKLNAEARFSSPWQRDGRPWRWRVYYHFTDFSDLRDRKSVV